MADTHAHDTQHHHGADAAHPPGGHATWQTYVIVGVILTVITAVEVGIFYIEAMAGVLVPILLLLSALKFFIVVFWYMHLKFDSKIYSRVFFAPLFLATLVVIGMVILFKVLPRYGVG
ncbi:MAG TPA: cytochrome C oxidase subunit IV family protein [Longimicrobiales bacterium]|nr:cytochrome C oxidase subunit IV family protein [Longimicrobiales bacterium]